MLLAQSPYRYKLCKMSQVILWVIIVLVLTAFTTKHPSTTALYVLLQEP
jgi:hypothetical protein